VYVGHTTNFVQRKHAHKQSCINPKATNYKVKLYEVIRANGGWNNWKMEIINFFECKDHYEARKKEQEYFIALNATLNSIEPLPKPKVIVPFIEKKEKDIFLCSTCNIYCSNSKLLEDHNKTNKHLKNIENPPPIENKSKNSKKLYCDACDFIASKESNYLTHLTTRKHQTLSNPIHKNANEKTKTYDCKCGKTYKHQPTLSAHRKICAIVENIQLNILPINNVVIDKKEEDKAIIELLIKENVEFKNIVLEIMKSNLDLQKQHTELQQQNNDIQKQLIDVCKNTNITNMSINNSNNNNKTFNLQFFLNEQCKDAMNLSDFANSFDLQLSDLETVGELGYVEGITKIMVDKLNSMDVYKRPIHCSDAKREIIYVKDENVWTKEEKDNPKLRQAIKNVSFRNMKLVYNWSNAYPESKDNQSKLNDTYMKLVIESTGGKGPILESENKIIRRIAKEILIDKM
jgi:hypothetical protein